MGDHFPLPFRITKKSKVQCFQFGISHKMLAKNSILQKIKKGRLILMLFCEKEIELRTISGM